MAMVARRSRADTGSTTQRPRLPTSYSKRKRRSLGTHRLLHLAKDVVEKENRGGGANGAGELPNWGKWNGRDGRARGRRRRGGPALGGADGEEGEARASLAGPIYRPARPVSRR
jgi:hypothetical protein